MLIRSSRRALPRTWMAVPRVMRETREASLAPSLLVDAAASPQIAARAALVASTWSSLSLRRRAERSDRSTSRTSIPASARWLVMPAPERRTPQPDTDGITE